LTSDLGGYVTLTTAQTISGAKTFSRPLRFANNSPSIDFYAANDSTYYGSLFVNSSFYQFTAAGTADWKFQNQAGNTVFQITQAGVANFFYALNGTTLGLTGALSGTSATFSNQVYVNYANPVVRFKGATLDGYIINSTDKLYIADYLTATKGLIVDLSTGALSQIGGGAATFSSSVTATSAVFANSSVLSTVMGSPQLRLINNAAATANQRVDLGLRWEDGTYNGIGGISMVRESATARSGRLVLSGINSAGDPNEAVNITSGGNVGIGTSSPNSKLSVTGDITLQSAGAAIRDINNNALLSVQNSNEIWLGGGGSGFSTLFYTGGAERMRITSGGQVQLVGTTGNLRLGTNTSDFATLLYSGGGTYLKNDWASTSAFLDLLANSVGFRVQGTGNATLTGTLTQGVSDKRFKKNIEIIPNALEKINLINGYTFEYDLENEDLTYIPKEGRDIGVIAQEIEQIIPEAVSLAPIDRNEDNESKSGKNYLTVNYEKIIPLLIQSIKELKAEIEILKNK
jgi:polyisoprenoid-binding protein YceI